MQVQRIQPATAALVLVATLCLISVDSPAQQLIMKGEYGMMAGTMAPPGLYVGAFGYNSFSSEFVDGNGTGFSGPAFNQWVFGPMVQVVTDLKLLGGSYSAAGVVPWANVNSDFPRLGVDTSTGVGLTQLYIVPFSLGWHLARADVTMHYAIYPPTGRYTPGASDNTGLGMWANEFSLRGTYFFDKAETWHGSLSLFYDINGKKKDLDYTTGNPFTIMYGFGRNFGTPGKNNFGWAGVAGYAQWQVTATSGADVPSPVAANKTQIYAVGPELTALQGALTVRYLWQFGAQFSTQGQTLYTQFAMPIMLFGKKQG